MIKFGNYVQDDIRYSLKFIHFFFWTAFRIPARDIDFVVSDEANLGYANLIVAL